MSEVTFEGGPLDGQVRALASSTRGYVFDVRGVRYVYRRFDDKMVHTMTNPTQKMWKQHFKSLKIDFKGNI